MDIDDIIITLNTMRRIIEDKLQDANQAWADLGKAEQHTRFSEPYYNNVMQLREATAHIVKTIEALRVTTEVGHELGEPDAYKIHIIGEQLAEATVYKIVEEGKGFYDPEPELS